ncbi:hypothetical protein N8996_07455 [Candidatus Poseidonia alphae]|nr:hypothetical protein [Candidatus Poseidonia alphae]
MSEEDINEYNKILVKALDNDVNEGIQKYNSNLIKQIKNNYLQKLLLPREKLKIFHSKLKDYRYVDDLSDIQYGRYIRWIKLNDPAKIILSTGGVIIDIKILQNGIHVVCKNFNNQRFQIKIDECYIFQKLTDQEKIILFALDHVNT